MESCDSKKLTIPISPKDPFVEEKLAILDKEIPDWRVRWKVDVNADDEKIRGLVFLKDTISEENCRFVFVSFDCLEIIIKQADFK